MTRRSWDNLPAALFHAAEPYLPRAAGFQMTDHWTLGIYRAILNDAGRHELHLVDQLRTKKCDLSKARKWPEGVGFTGIAFTQSKEIIVDDARNPAIASVFSLPGSLARSHDGSTYVSYAVVPILVGDPHIPWGVAIGTSNRASHFNFDTGVQSSEAVRAIAGMVALGIALHKKKNDSPKVSEEEQDGTA